jgi:hypothetical protein
MSFIGPRCTRSDVDGNDRQNPEDIVPSGSVIRGRRAEEFKEEIDISGSINESETVA